MLAAVLFQLQTAEVFSQGFLRTKGTEITNDDGPVILRSIGTGNWMIQEGYMMQSTRAGIATQQQFQDKLIETIGEERTKQFYDSWLHNHFTKTDVDSIKVWGFNAIRVALHYKWFTPPIENEKRLSDGTLDMTWIDKGFVMIDELLSWCEANEMYLILDMHGAPGGQGKNASISDYDPSKPSLWESEENKDKLIALWVRLADRYKNSKWIGGFDLINEPNWSLDGSENQNGCECQDNDDIWDLHERMIREIRKVNKNHIVYISGNCWGGNYSSFENHTLKEADDNMALTFHKYWTNNKPGAIDKWLAMRKRYQLPLWMSEGGENSNTWFSDCIALYERNRIGWSWWPVKKSKVNNVLKVVTDKSYTDLIDSWQNNQPLSPDSTYAAVMQYAANHNIENCIVARDVIYAMTQQADNFDTSPYKIHHLGQPIFFADFDMGREGYAYHDMVSADYHADDGADWANWNSGNFYRNDGVDIGDYKGSPFVGWTEAGEWMQYSLDVQKEGNYNLRIRATGGDKDMIVRLEVNLQVVGKDITFSASDNPFDWKSAMISGLKLPKGHVSLRFHIVNGGGNLMDFTFIEP